MNKLKTYVLAVVMMSSLAVSAEENLRFTGKDTLLYFQDGFDILIRGEVKGGCLPRPTNLKDKMETSLRKNGFDVGGGVVNPDPIIIITATGYLVDSQRCVVDIKATLQLQASLAVPFTYDVDSGKLQLTYIEYLEHIGGYLVNQDKVDMQLKLEQIAYNLGDDRAGPDSLNTRISG